MWLWQHKNVRNKILLWAKLSGISLFFHILLLIWLFFLYHDSSEQCMMTIHKKADYSVPILYKTIPVVTTQSSVTPQQKPTPIKNVMTGKKNVPKKAPITHMTEKTIVKKEISLQPTTKHSEPMQKIEPKKQPLKEIKKSLPSAHPKPVKEYTHKQIEQKQPVACPTIQIPDNAIISDNYREVEALRRSSQLQKEVEQNWKPPIGAAHDCSCEIALSIGKHGKIEKLKMVRCSPIAMYDISARQAILSMKMPQWTYGKSLIISFKQ